MNAIKENAVMKDYSPHLLGVLQRLDHTPNIAILKRIFTHCLQHGGLLEQDFARESGVSYNPLPARVTLIAINNGGLQLTTELAATMLSSISYRHQLTYLELEKLIEDSQVAVEVCSLLEYTNLAPQALCSSLEQEQTDPKSALCASCIIKLCVRLDRLRHLHLGNMTKESYRSHKMENLPYLTLASLVSLPLYKLLDRWQKRTLKIHD